MERTPSENNQVEFKKPEGILCDVEIHIAQNDLRKSKVYEGKMILHVAELVYEFSLKIEKIGAIRSDTRLPSTQHSFSGRIEDLWSVWYRYAEVLIADNSPISCYLISLLTEMLQKSFTYSIDHDSFFPTQRTFRIKKTRENIPLNQICETRNLLELLG